jgi:hypothetical protein
MKPMPLLDHFHPPLFPLHRWESFHSFWATDIASHLNFAVLPTPYFSEAIIHFNGSVEVDLTGDEWPAIVIPPPSDTVAVARAVWAPPAPPLVLQTSFPDEIEVQVFGSPTGAHLVAAIELVSPGNKARPEKRDAFVSKCSSYLQSGLGLIVVDMVTDRLSNLHDELMRRMGQPPVTHFPPDTMLYAVAYRPARRSAGDQIDCWPVSLVLGGRLPVLPLALRDGPTFPVDLETTYLAACRRSRL